MCVSVGKNHTHLENNKELMEAQMAYIHPLSLLSATHTSYSSFSHPIGCSLDQIHARVGSGEFILGEVHEPRRLKEQSLPQLTLLCTLVDQWSACVCECASQQRYKRTCHLLTLSTNVSDALTTGYMFSSPLLCPPYSHTKPQYIGCFRFNSYNSLYICP